MTDHRPECPWPDKPCGPDHEPMHDREPMFCVACLTECICDRLRACEERVEESMDRAWTHTLRIKQAEAHTNGVQAARDAVNQIWVDSVPDAIAAIDALKGKP